MFKPLFPLAAALLIAGCSSDQVPLAGNAPAVVPVPMLPATPQVAAPYNRTMVKPAFASLPDRGALLAYPSKEAPRRRGAFTSHAVQLSEAHALNAAAPGKHIDLPLPGGETMRLQYQRHEESLDGNWTWVGRTRDGLDAVLTFGPDAVFGRITQKNQEPLRLTMADGRAWLVETDASQLHDGNLLRDADESDGLIPPKQAIDALARKQAAAAASSVVAANDVSTSATPANTIDVVLGYTNGLVTKYGGVSQANTRLTNLIAITNQGYQNSQVTPRVRLVRTHQVSYTDTTSNEVALEALTGVVCNPNCTSQPVPAELQPLRAARDQYGGDLVSLVRPFQAPQHDGCGIAWLLGGGGFTIDNTDAPFGYSIVSDGTDFDETDGKNYFCREETLSHEMGHNMGQAHNVEDSGGDPGTHPYSYGYRESTTTGFYTVMAYRLPSSSQVSINHFGNPNVTYADTGRPTGTATADNARSLNISMPLVVQFRAAVVPFETPSSYNLMALARGATGSAKVEVHTLSASTNYAAFSQHIATALHSLGDNFTWDLLVSDYNGDGIRDIYILNRMGASNTTEVHVLNGADNYQSFLLHAATALHQTGSANDWVFRFADFNGDSKPDLYVIKRNGASGKTEMHVLNGANNFSSYLLHAATLLHNTGSDGAWAFELGDWNKDGRADLFVFAKIGASNTTEVHVIDGASNFQSYLLNRATALHQTGANYTWDFKLGDYNGDGTLDVYTINRQGGSGNVELHILDGASTFTSFSAHIATGLHNVPANNTWEFELIN